MSEDRVQNREHRNVDNRFQQSGKIIPTPRGNPSPFMKVLDQTRNQWTPMNNGSSAPSQPQQAATGRPVEAPIHREGERQGRQGEERDVRSRDLDREREKSPEKAKGSDDSHTRHVKEADRRVVGRQQNQERQGHDSKGSGNQGGAGQRQGGKGSVLLTGDAGKSAAKTGELGQTSFAAKLALAARVSAEQSARAKSETPQISKQLIDQIVAYVKLVTRSDGEKEMDISLHEKVFRGLRLKVAMVRGKAEVTFLTRGEEVRNLLTSQKGALREHLAQKGIDIRKIDVIMV